MTGARSGLVDIAREFLAAHELMRRLFARHRAGTLRFEELEELVGDDEHSVLFRLKERCHLSFRSGDGAPPLHSEALFDLAVGSLFHEAMKFRENFYQREVYGPRVEALRSEADEPEAALFAEFARIQDGVSARLEEGLAETEALLARSLEPLARLLFDHREDPLVARFLLANAVELEAALDRPLRALLAELYGDAATGYLRAGRSLLQSGYYPEAANALEAAAELGGEAGEVGRLVAYARGMQAYLAGDYAESVARLSDWVDADAARAPELAGLAQDAVARISQLASGAERQQIVARAGALLTRMGEDA